MNEKILLVLSWICEKHPAPCKKYIQKLMYLIERRGVDLGLEYRIHYYGPYCSELNDILFELEKDNLIDINTYSLEHTINVSPVSNQQALSKEEQKIVNQVLADYAGKTPRELEILATTDFIAEGLRGDNKLSREALVKFVTDVKGKKFPQIDIINSIDTLVNDKFITIN